MTAFERLRRQRIDKTAPIPYYCQIAQVLRETIREIELDPQPEPLALPSEAELCRAYDVTRGTVRHALQLLDREGLIYKQKGLGTFVRRHRVELDLTRLRSTTDDLRARGWTPTARVLSLHRATPRSLIQHELGISTDQDIWELFRLRLADGEAIGIQWCYIPCRIAPDLDESELNGSLYLVWRDSYGVELTASDQVIRARLATRAEAKLLHISEGDPVFAVDGTDYDQNGSPVECEHSVWRGDRYDLRVRLVRMDPTGVGRGKPTEDMDPAYTE